MEQITVLRKHPRRNWEVITIDNTLEALWREVDGYIETVTLAADAVVIVNEEGRLRGLEPNHCLGCDWAGTVLLAGVKGDQLTDVPAAVIHLAQSGKL